MKIIQTVKQLPQQGLNGVVIDWLVDLVSMMSDYFLKERFYVMTKTCFAEEKKNRDLVNRKLAFLFQSHLTTWCIVESSGKETTFLSYRKYLPTSVSKQR